MMTVSTQSRFFWLCLFLIVVGCGPSGQAVEETLMVEVAQAVPGTVAAIASATPLPTLTPQSTFTPHATYTPLPTLTLAPTLSPRPTYTPFPTLTPLPTATAIPSATSTLTRRPITPTPAVNLKETLLLEVNRRIFYYESYNGTFYARCDLFGCDYSLACDQVVYFYDLLSAPYTVDVSQADPAIQVAHQKLQTAIAQAATGYGWANTCRAALASGTGVTTQNASQGEPNVPVEVISLLREAQTILASQP